MCPNGEVLEDNVICLDASTERGACRLGLVVGRDLEVTRGLHLCVESGGEKEGLSVRGGGRGSGLSNKCKSIHTVFSPASRDRRQVVRTTRRIIRKMEVGGVASCVF